MAKPQLDYSQISAEERIELAEELWDSLAETPEAVPLTEAQADELDRRIDAYRKNRDPGTPWREALQAIKESGT